MKGIEIAEFAASMGEADKVPIGTGRKRFAIKNTAISRSFLKPFLV